MEVSIRDQMPTPSPPSLSSKRRKQTQTLTIKPSLWRTDRTRQIYSAKLLSSLHRLRLSSASTVRAAADRSLAAAAHGGFCWNRAILSVGRVSLRKVRRARLNRPRKPVQKAARPDRGEAAEAERKARVLGRLIPGCKKLSLPSLLDETADYIAALEMQVRAMSVIADVLSAVAPSSPQS